MLRDMQRSREGLWYCAMPAGALQHKIAATTAPTVYLAQLLLQLAGLQVGLIAREVVQIALQVAAKGGRAGGQGRRSVKPQGVDIALRRQWAGSQLPSWIGAAAPATPLQSCSAHRCASLARASASSLYAPKKQQCGGR